MQYRNDQTGRPISLLGYGCMRFTRKGAGIDLEKAEREVLAAIGAGVNYFDTAYIYPGSEAALGEILDRNHCRDQVRIATKLPQYLVRGKGDFERYFSEELRRLRTDHVDVGMIHYVDAEKDFHTVFDHEIIEIAQRLKAEGKIRHIGMSSHNPLVASMAVKTGLIDVLLFSINPCYDLLPPNEDVDVLFDQQSYAGALHNIDPAREQLYALCEREGVAIDVMKVFGGGDLLDQENSPFGCAFTPVQAIDYALTRPAVAAVMLGCKTQDEMAAAIAWCQASPEERDYTAVMTHLDRFSWRGHCMYCGHCAPCTSKIDIAAVNKFYNLTVAQGEIPETVREHYKALEHHASECIACGACETRCPFGVQIVESMQRAAQRFGY